MQYYAESHGVIYVIDSTDEERLSESKEAFGQFHTRAHAQLEYACGISILLSVLGLKIYLFVVIFSASTCWDIIDTY